MKNTDYYKFFKQSNKVIVGILKLKINNYGDYYQESIKNKYETQFGEKIFCDKINKLEFKKINKLEKTTTTEITEK